jgi:ABC-type antimicrobial peptide transport system permease subunit
MNLLARAAGDPAAVLAPLREAVWDIDSGLPLPEYGTLSEHAADSILEPRFYTLLLSTFAAVALVLALVGVYGTLAYTVELRTRELGVRLAMGDRSEDVLALVLRRGMTLVGIGLVAGVIISMMTAAALERFVFGITPRDPGTLVVVVAAMAALALAACMIPALRAARLDPATTLRSE